MQDYKKLDVWMLAVELATDIYKETMSFPKSEMYGLVDQMKRSAVSVASNIAEGAGRATSKDFAHFLSMANGSSCELETQLIISANIGFIEHSELNELTAKITRIRKMITKFRQHLLR
jgi:four helix bundle protein